MKLLLSKQNSNINSDLRNSPLTGLRQFLTIKNFYPLQMMKNAYFMLKALFIFETLTILFWLSHYAEKWLDKNAMVKKGVTLVLACTLFGMQRKVQFSNSSKISWRFMGGLYNIS